MQKATIASEHTAQRISKTITFFKNESKAASMLQQNGPKPLLLLLPWLGSRPHAVDKYREIYFRQGFDVLTVESEPSHFLWPRWGLDYGVQVLELLQSDSFVSRPLLLHAFSIGGYTFAQMMVHISMNAQQYKSVTDRIKGQVYDSLVIGSVERMAEGVSKMFFPSLQGLVQWSTLLYFRVLEGYTVDYYNAAIEVFWNNPLQTPSLFFTSENDPLSDHKAREIAEKVAETGDYSRVQSLERLASCRAPSTTPTGVPGDSASVPAVPQHVSERQSLYRSSGSHSRSR